MKRALLAQQRAELRAAIDLLDKATTVHDQVHALAVIRAVLNNCTRTLFPGPAEERRRGWMALLEEE